MRMGEDESCRRGDLGDTGRGFEGAFGGVQEAGGFARSGGVAEAADGGSGGEGAVGGDGRAPRVREARGGWTRIGQLAQRDEREDAEDGVWRAADRGAAGPQREFRAA